MDVFYITVKFYFKICQFVGYTQKTFVAPKKKVTLTVIHIFVLFAYTRAEKIY